METEFSLNINDASKTRVVRELEDGTEVDATEPENAPASLPSRGRMNSGTDQSAATKKEEEPNAN